MMSRSLRLSFQCDLECQYTKHVVFVTLTYANEHLPTFEVEREQFVDDDGILRHRFVFVDSRSGEILDNAVTVEREYLDFCKKTARVDSFGYLRKRDLQLFIKRFRFYERKVSDTPIRYFACGEYGPLHFRPHFHLLFFLQDDSQLAACEQSVLASWKFGRTDVQTVSGNAAQYVASYVNGGCTLPSFFKRGAFSPFCLHSWRLGQGFFKSARSAAYSVDTKAFIRRSLVVDGKFKEFDLWRSCYAYFFPKCKGFADKSTRRRVESYRIYETGRKLFPQCGSCIELARQTAFMLITFYNPEYRTSKFLPDSPGEKDVISYLNYFADTCPPGAVYDLESKDVQNFVYRIYLELSLSRHFLDYVCDRRTVYEIERKVRMIEKFYSDLDYMRLTEFFEAQRQYFEQDFACEDDVVYFYDNVKYEPESLKELPVYKIYDADVHNRYEDAIKHKKLNDINKILFPDDEKDDLPF